MSRPVVLLLVSLVVATRSAGAQTIAPVSALTTSVDGANATGEPGISVASLIRELGGDFRDLPSLDTALILGIGGGLSVAVHEHDAQVTRRFSTSPGVEALLEPGEGTGGAIQVAVSVGVYALGRGIGSRRVSLLGADLVRGQLMNTVLTQGIKIAVGRRRPDGSRFSFPSGHTSLSVATATVLQRHLGWRAGVPAYGLAAFVAGSRLQENKHYLSDVLFGASIGLVSGRTVTLGRRKGQLVASPFLTAGGGGLGFTLVNRQQSRFWAE